MECTGPAAAVFDPRLTDYDFGPQHPMSPLRIDLTMRLAAALGVTRSPDHPDGLPVRSAEPATVEQLATVHTTAMIDAVRRAGDTLEPDPAFGLGSDDTPVFARMHEASAHIVGATLEACRLVVEGEVEHAVNVAGGLHHAMPDRASGFCVYNDAAVGIRWLLAHGCAKVAYVDVDVHHGDGVEKVFWDDPRVLTVSLHETGQTLFPGTGFAHDVGGPGARGSAVNIALPPGTQDGGWLRAFHAVVPEVLAAFEPDVIVTQHGCDSHREDPLADLLLSVDGQRATALALHDLAHEVTDGRWVALGGGGYAIVDVVPRAWTHLLAVAAGRPVDPSTRVPQEWRDYVREHTGLDGPSLMTDGRVPDYRDWYAGYDPAAWLDRSVQATRAATFPLHGLDPSL